MRVRLRHLALWIVCPWLTIDDLLWVTSRNLHRKQMKRDGIDPLGYCTMCGQGRAKGCNHHPRMVR